MADPSRLGRAVRGLAASVRRGSVFPPVRFLLLTPGRAGSTLLMTLLAAVPGVRCDGEALRTVRRKDPTVLLARRAARAALGNATAWGTSVHPEHLLRQYVDDPVRWIASMHDEGYELITLVRENPLAVALSAVVADQRGAWHFLATERDPSPEQTPVRLDPMHVLRIAVQAEQSTEDVRRWVAERSHLALVYEDDLLEPEQHQPTADRVLRYLGIPVAPVSTPLRRQARPLAEQIENFDEVSAVLRQTRFAALLDTSEP